MTTPLTLTRDSSATQKRWQECLEEARGGCRDAQARLLEAVRPYLVVRASRGLDTEMRAKMTPSDVVQEVLLKAWGGLPGFRGSTRAEMIAWLHELLKNESLQAVRKHQTAKKRSIKREERLETGNTPAGELRSLDPSPSQDAMGREKRERIEQALRRLPARDEQIIRLRSQTELSFSEIGRVLEISEEAARKRFARAVQCLGQELNEHAS